MKGFSLLEIMVTVAIVAIMASSVVIGFNSFGETVRTRETAGVITDTLKNLELETIRRDYKSQLIHFKPDYLVVEVQVENQNPDMTLTWNGRNGNCEELDIANDTGSVVYLTQRDQNGNNMQIQAYPGNDTICVDFLDSEETEWQYQLFKGGDRSQIIRLIHFNIRRDNSSEKPAIQPPHPYSLKITAPYASKEFYKNDDPWTGSVELELQDGGEPVTITLQ